MAQFEFTAEVWVAPADDAWRFVTVPAEVADDIRMITGPRRGFGSVRVEVTVGRTTWRTSVFPDSRKDSFILPVKKSVRDAEDIDDGDTVTVELRLVDVE